MLGTANSEAFNASRFQVVTDSNIGERERHTHNRRMFTLYGGPSAASKTLQLLVREP